MQGFVNAHRQTVLGKTAVLDLNGDGKLEVIVHSFYYEGGQTTIYRCELDKIEAVLFCRMRSLRDTNSCAKTRAFFYKDAVELLGPLKRHFGHDQFRPLQREIVQDALAGQDVLCLCRPAAGNRFVFSCRH